MLTFLAPLLLVFTPALAQSDPLVVNLTSGTFRGAVEANGTERWLGVPFAQAPVGALRFTSPQRVTDLSPGVQNASAFGNACPQPPSTSLGAAVGEDCLRLNVCALPVVIWYRRPTRRSRDACAGLEAARNRGGSGPTNGHIFPRKIHRVLFSCVRLSERHTGRVFNERVRMIVRKLCARAASHARKLKRSIGASLRPYS
jgi:hypothetical protein